jgi:hypothetical protein
LVLKGLTNDFVTKKMCPELNFVTFVEPSEWCAVHLLTVTAVTADSDLRGFWSDVAGPKNKLCNYKNNMSVEE